MSSAGAASGSWRSWTMGRLDRRDPGRRASESNQAPARRREDEISITLFDLAKEEAEQRGFDKGYTEGLERGYAEGETRVRAEQEQALASELAAKTAPMTDLVDAFRKAVDEINNQIARQLVDLALETGQQLAGRALDIKPEHILDDVEELLAAHPDLAGTPTVYLNMDDLELVEAHLATTLTAAGWQLRPDVALERGDCRIETEDREIDATLEDRWARLLHVVGHGEH